MKTLQESLLDDEDKLLHDTGAEKGFPKKSEVKKYIINNLNISYYQYNNQLNMSRVLKKIHAMMKVLYVRWFKLEDNTYVIQIQLSRDIIEKSANLYPFFDNSSKSESEAKNKAYELLINIKNHPDILYFIYNEFTLLDHKFCIDDLKKEFKDTWQEIKK